MIITLPWLGALTCPTALFPFCAVASFRRTAGLPSIMTLELPAVKVAGPLTALETTPPTLPLSFPELGVHAEF